MSWLGIGIDRVGELIREDSKLVFCMYVRVLFLSSFPWKYRIGWDLEFSVQARWVGLG